MLQTSDLRDSFLERPVVGYGEKLKGTNELARNKYTPSKLALKNPGGKRIDYVLFKGNRWKHVKVTAYAHPDKMSNYNFSYSDHEAIVTKLCLSDVTLNAKDDAQSIMLIAPPDVRPVTYTESLKECIAECEAALQLLLERRQTYFSFSLTSFILLLGVINMSDSLDISIWSGFMLTLQMLLTILVMFGILMGTLWHNIEWNGIYSGKLSMEIHLRLLDNTAHVSNEFESVFE